MYITVNYLTTFAENVERCRLLQFGGNKSPLSGCDCYTCSSCFGYDML